MDHTTTTFLSGYAAFQDLLFFAKEEAGRSSSQGVVCGFFALDGEDWSQYFESVNWPAISMASIKPDDVGRIVVAIGPHGEYWESLAESEVENIGELSASERILARRVSVVEETILAVGMGRKVLRREPGGGWTSIGPTAALPEGKAAGFNDLVGNSLDEMYAVGWHGEIWAWDGRTWTSIDSPTSSHLSAAFCTSDGTVLAVGYDGAMVRGRGDEWSIVETGRAENLLGVCSFGGEIYVCSAYKLMRLAEDGLVPVENLADPADPPSTCLHLLVSNDKDAVFSMGPKDLFRLRGGVWTRLA